MTKNEIPTEISIADELEKSIFFKSRKVFLSGEVDSDMSYKICKKLTSLDAHNEKDIYLIINSPGGDADAGKMIMDSIRLCRSQIVTIISGLAASMGAFIALQGSQRCITNMSWFMLHDTQLYMNDYLHTSKPRFDFIQRETEDMFEWAIARTQLNKADIHKMKNSELWLNSDECLKKGIVHKIL